MSTPEIFFSIPGDTQFTKGTGVLCSGLLAYKNFLISGGGLPNWPASKTRRAFGRVVRIAPGGKTVVLQRLEDGREFDSREEAEAHALELCKEWVDAQIG